MKQFSPSIGHTALVWGLNDRTQFEQAVRKTGELGFRGTETWGKIYDQYDGNLGALRDLLQANQVTLASLFHVGRWTDPAARAELVETAHRWASGVGELGGAILMLVPGFREQPSYTAAQYQVMADAMNECGEAARAAGIRAAMHPHWGTTVETTAEIEQLLALLDPELVGFAPDSGQIAKGGGDPVALARKYAQRIWHVHLKDLSPQWQQMQAAGVPLNSPKGYAELGEGVCDLKGFVQVLRDASYGGWILAELDESNYTPDQSATINRAYMERELGFAFPGR